MTDDLSEKLAVLTEARPEPSDPAAPIRQRIILRRKRRRVAATMVTAAAVAAAALSTGPALGTLQSDEPQVANDNTSTVSKAKRQPEPWSDQLTPQAPLPELTKQPKPSYVVGEGGSTGGNYFAVLVDARTGCLTTYEGTAQVADIVDEPFCPSPAADKPVWTKTRPLGLGPGSKYRLFLGTVDTRARRVRLTFGPAATANNDIPLGWVDTQALATPASDSRRSFVALIAVAESPQSVQAYDEAGRELK
jgi:hypothetical protein